MSTTLATLQGFLNNYTQAQEDTYASTLTGKPSGYAIIYNTDLEITRVWNGTVFENTTLPVTNPNQKVIRQLSDFPTPSGGIITLEDYTTYQISGTVDIGTNRIICGIKNTITGIDRQNDILTSSTVGNMFTMDNSVTPKQFLVFDTITIQATAGTLMSVSGGTTDQVTFISTTISSTVNGGSISGIGFSMRTSSISSAFSGGGFVFSGNNLSFVLRDSTVSNNTGTAFDFSSATFSSSILISRAFVVTNASQTFVNATGTTVGIAGQVAISIFSGAGTQFTGVTAQTSLWLFSDNQGITNTVNGNSQLIETTSSGKYPALDGSLITNISGGTASVTSQEVSVIASNLSVRIDTVSNAVSIVSANVATISTNVSAISTRADVISQQVSVLSARVATNSAQMVSADNAISNAVSIVSAAQGVTSAQVTANSAQMTSADNAISNAVSVLSARVASNSAQVTSALGSINNIGDVSVDGVTSGQVLGYNSATAQWVPKTPTGGSGSVTSANFVSLRGLVQSNSAQMTANSAQMTSADNAISQAVSIVSVAQATTSAAVTSVNQIVSALSANVATISLNVSAISTRADVISQQVSVLSARVATNSAQMVSADNAISNAVSVVSVAQAVTSAQVTTNSAQMTSADNAISQAVSIVSVAQATTSAAVTSVNQVVSALSANVATISLNISAISTRADVISQQVSVLSSRVATNSAQMTSAFGSINNLGDVSTTGATSGQVLGYVSATSEWVPKTITGGSGSVTSANFVSLRGLVQSNSAQMTSADNAISNAVSIVSAAQAVTSAQVTTNSAQMTSADNAISNAVSIVSVAQATTSAAVTSVNQIVSALSANVAGISLNISAISTRADVISQQVSVLSARVDTNSAQMVSADNAISNAVSIVSVAQANTSAQVTTNSAQMTSADNAISGAVVALSALLSTTASALSARINTVSNAVSALVLDSLKDVSAPSPADVQVLTWNSAQAQWVASTITAGVGSVTSAEVSAVSAAAASADASLSVRIDTVSNVVSALSVRADVISQKISVLSAGFGAPQMVVVADLQSISVSVLTNVSGLSVSIAANGVYQIQSQILYNVSAISATGFQFALVASGMTQQNVVGNWQGTSAGAVSTGGVARAIVNQPFNGLSGAKFSVVSAGTAAVNRLVLDALVVASTTGGSLQIQSLVNVGTTSMYIYKGSFIRAVKIA